MTKTFTLAEAQTLLPVLGSLMRRAQAAELRAAVLEAEMQALSHRIFLIGGMHVDVAVAAKRRAEREKAAQDSKDAVAEIEAIGARVEDLRGGLLDFPSVVDGRAVLLCWRVEEKRIGFWHGESEGAAERKPVERLFGLRERLH